MKFFIATILITIISAIGISAAQKSQKNMDASPSSPSINHGQEQEHSTKSHEHNKEEAHEHGKEEAQVHDKVEADEHGHEEGERRNVGPDKGVLEASEDLGFKLRKGVEERFGIKSLPISTGKPGNLPKGAVVYSKEDYQVFRRRDGFWKPIKVKATRRGDVVAVETTELKAGDQVAIEGLGFLKIVELSVFGPAIEGHIH